MAQRIVVVDAFADAPFTGNPAAVCVMITSASDAWMQSVAAEINLAETAFVTQMEETFGLRWFTPEAEVELCGHATLAAAHHLWESGEVDMGEPARFTTRSGLLTATRVGDRITLDFPALPVSACAEPPGLAAALGVNPVFVGQSTFDTVIEVASEAEVRAANPDFGALAKIQSRGFVITSRADSDAKYEVVSRCFYPGLGVPEDPVTGSAHCALAGYWCEKLGRDAWVGYQASRRGGRVGVTLKDGRVALTGRAVTNWRGQLLHGPN